LCVIYCSSLKVGFLLPSTIDDFGYSYKIWQDIQELQSNFPSITTNYTENVTVNTCINIALSYMNNNFDVLFFLSSPFDPCAQLIAISYPTKKFITQNAGGIVHQNITNLSINFKLGVTEARFIVGALAGKHSHTGKICLIIPKFYPFRHVFTNYFYLGIQHVNGPSQLLVGFTSGFDDRVTDTKVINHFLSVDCDIIVQHAVNSITTQQIVASNGKLGIGWATDMRDFIGESVLTSIVFDWVPMFTFYIEKILAGTFVNELYLDNLQNFGIKIADYSCLIDKSTRKETDKVYDKVFTGKLNPLCEPLINTLLGTPCVNDSQIFDFFFHGITIYDGTIV